MLHNLLKSLNDIVPVEYIEEKNQNLVIVYSDPDIVLTTEQQSQINALLNTWPVTKLQYQKIKQINNNWKIKLNEGWITSYGWSLGIDVQDVALLTGAFTLAKEASNLGITDPVSIVDKEGLSHELNLADLTSLMLSYGQARSQLSGAYASKLNAIKNATSVEELEALDLTL